MNTYRENNPDLFELWEAVDTTDDYGHGGGARTTNGPINISETKKILDIVYDAATPLKLQSTGTGDLDFQLYIGGIATGVALTVAAGNTLNTTLGSMAGSGDALYVINKSNTTAGSYSVTI